MAGQTKVVRWLLAGAAARCVKWLRFGTGCHQRLYPDAAAGFSAGYGRTAAVRWPGSSLWRQSG